jgi:hypothetical protein
MSILLADRILAGAKILDCTELPLRRFDTKNLLPTLEKAQKFDLTNTSDYWWATDADKKWGANELSAVRAPFRNTWTEVSNADIPRAPGEMHPSRSGVLVIETEPISPRDANLFALKVFSGGFTWLFPLDEWPTIHLLSFTVFQSYPNTNATRRTLSALGFPEMGNSEWIQYLGGAFIAVLPNGKPCSQLVTSGVGISSPDLISSREMARESTQKLGEVKANEVFSTLFGFQFLHCKNVNTIEHQPSPRLSKAFNKRHGRPLVTYKTLEIEPAKKMLEVEGGIAHNGLKKALHICRGHFATYTPEKPLFGRVTGTVWKPSHVRGDATHGIVQKDYKVKAPAN